MTVTSRISSGLQIYAGLSVCMLRARKSGQEIENTCSKHLVNFMTFVNMNSKFICSHCNPNYLRFFDNEQYRMFTKSCFILKNLLRRKVKMNMQRFENIFLTQRVCATQGERYVFPSWEAHHMVWLPWCSRTLRGPTPWRTATTLLRPM